MKYPLSDDELQLRNATRTKKKAIEKLSFSDLFLFQSFFYKDEIQKAYQFLIDNSDITEQEKQIIKDWYIR